MTDPAQQARLRAVKLRALVHDHGIDVTDAVAGDFPSGAALLVGGGAWVLAGDQPERSLGPALAWTLRHEAVSLDLLVEGAAGLLARRAAAFSLPVRVWEVQGRELRPAVAEPLPVPAEVPPSHRSFVELIVAAGAQPNEEHGVLIGEVDGLEVCRVVDDPHTGTTRLEVGVGAHDREAFLLVHGDRPTAEALSDVVRSVALQRRPGARQHPLNLLARERALRSRLVAEPSLIGATSVRPVSPPVPRRNLKEISPCVAVADVDGVAHTVVVSYGVDLDVVPYAVDARAATGVGPTMVVVRARDLVPVLQRLAAALVDPVHLVTIDDG